MKIVLHIDWESRTVSMEQIGPEVRCSMCHRWFPPDPRHPDHADCHVCEVPVYRPTIVHS